MAETIIAEFKAAYSRSHDTKKNGNKDVPVIFGVEVRFFGFVERLVQHLRGNRREISL